MTRPQISANQVTVPRQLELDLPKWGGRREGAGRKPLHDRPGLIRPGVPHLRRPGFKARHPLHATLRLLKGIPSLRRMDVRHELERAFRAARERFGFRLVHYSIQTNHLHLLVEADDLSALSRGMQGLTIRCARAINRALGRKGKVFADRFHARALGSRREVRNALRYVLENARRHGDLNPRDLYSSQRWLWRKPDDDAPVMEPRTWLLRTGWRIQGNRPAQPDGPFGEPGVKPS